MKTISKLLLAVLAALAVILTGCEENIVEDVKISLNKSVLVLDKGQTEQLNPVISPATADVVLEWTSADPSVATVSEDGLVEALKAGETVITVSAGKANATCKVTVSPVPVDQIVLDKEEAEIEIGETLALNASVFPEDAEATVIWSSLNEKVAVVEDGVVTALEAGVATIVAKAGNQVAQCVITVSAPFVSVKSVKITTYPKDALIEGDEFQFVAEINPVDATDQRLEWHSANTAVLTIDQNGKAVAVEAGTVEVTVTSADGGKTDKCVVTVEPKVYPVESVEITALPEDLKMVEGDKFTFACVVKPDNASNKSVVWSSSDEDVLKIDSEGNAEALKAGNVTVKVTTADGGKTAECEITVDPKVYPVESVEITAYPEGFKLVEGDKFAFACVVSPENASDKTVAWTSSDEAVLKIDSEGNAEALKAGNVTVKVTTADGGKTAECEITVDPKVYPVESVEITAYPEGFKLVEGDKFAFACVVSPENATDKTVAWTSSDEAVLKIDSEGNAEALKAGKVTVTVTAADGGKTAECEITVDPKVYPVTGVTLDKTSAELTEGDVLVLTAILNPENATNRNLTWSSSDETVAKVTDGKVTALKSGTATISVKTEDGGKTAECKVTVVEKTYPVTGLTLDKTEGTLKVGEEMELEAVVLPLNATNRNISWTSSDEAVVAVTPVPGAEGRAKVKALNLGTAKVIVTTSDGGKTAECTVNVLATPVESVTITSKPGTEGIVVGDSFNFKAEVLPADATDKAVTWTSSDNSVLSIDSEGKASALAVGKAVVTATADGKSDRYEVTVTPKPVESVEISKYVTSMERGNSYTFEATVLPADATDKSLVWSSSNSEVLTVSESGVVKAMAAGTAEVVVKSVDGGKTDKCTVTVTEPKVSVASVSLTSIPTGNKMTVGSSFTFAVKVLPENATDKSVTWKSSDENVIKIDSEGKATAVATGSASISVTSNDGGKVSKVLVTVVKAGSAVPVTGVTLSAENGLEEVRHGKTIQLVPTYSPSGSYPGDSQWFSSNEQLATVDANGLVKAISFDYSKTHSHYVQNGYPEVKITHMADGIPAVYKVKILPAVPEKIVVSNPPPTSLLLGQSWDMGDIYILPAEAEQKVTIISTYDGQFGGEIGSSFTASKVGVMNILITAMGEHAQTVYTGTSVNYTINVSPIKETSVVMNRTSYTIEEGSEFDISCNVLPSNATYKDLTWESSNSSVATVAGGRVKALSAGTATITAKSYHGVRASCTVTVKARTNAVSVGDYYYSDGTTSSELQSGKTPVGIVFALADPVGSDPATLGKDHSGCTHGLVVGLKSYRTAFARSAFIDDYPLNVVSANAASAGMLNMTSRTVMCGYSNTKALKNWGSWLVIDVCNDHAAEYKLPSSTSGWYFPSLGEMELLGDSYSIVNEKLKAIDQSYAIGAGLEFWVSTYFGVPTNSYTYIISEGGLAADVRQGVTTGAAMLSSDTRYARYIFAF